MLLRALGRHTMPRCRAEMLRPCEKEGRVASRCSPQAVAVPYLELPLGSKSFPDVGVESLRSWPLHYHIWIPGPLGLGRRPWTTTLAHDLQLRQAVQGPCIFPQRNTHTLNPTTLDPEALNPTPQKTLCVRNSWPANCKTNP